MENKESSPAPAKKNTENKRSRRALFEKCLLACAQEQIDIEEGQIVKLKPFPMSAEGRSMLMTQLLWLSLASQSEQRKIQAAKVIVAADMVNVNRERMMVAQAQGPAQHNTQINLYGGQVITGQIFASMNQLEREQALTAGAQLSPDAISALSPDELQRLLRSAQAIPPQLPNK